MSAYENEYRRYIISYLQFIDVGVKPIDAYLKLRMQGYTRTHRQLNRQIENFRTTGSPFSRVNSAGRKTLLDDAQMEEIRDWIEYKNDVMEPVERKDVQQFIKDTWDIECNTSTAGNILKRLNMTKRVMMTKKSGHTKNKVQLVEEYWDYIRELKRKRTLFVERSKIFSIDTTYTRQPTKHMKGYSERGSGTQICREKPYQYTDAIVTMICADGVNHTPSMLFTHNPKLNPEGPEGPYLRKLEKVCKRYGIKKNRIIYIHSSRKYCPENVEMYEHFLTSNRIPKDSVIFHDNGGGFKRGSESIFDILGFKNHQTFPSDVHQWLSPNDNNLHGVKTTWKKHYQDFGDSIKSPLSLMYLIDKHGEEHSQQFFDRNILKVQKKDIPNLMKG